MHPPQPQHRRGGGLPTIVGLGAGALLALDGQWQKLDKIRILMGDEVFKRTKKALLAGLQRIKQKLDSSIEREKEQNDFLEGVAE